MSKGMKKGIRFRVRLRVRFCPPPGILFYLVGSASIKLRIERSSSEPRESQGILRFRRSVRTPQLFPLRTPIGQKGINNKKKSHKNNTYDSQGFAGQFRCFRKHPFIGDCMEAQCTPHGPEILDFRQNGERRPAQAPMRRSPHLSFRRDTSTYIGLAPGPNGSELRRIFPAGNRVARSPPPKR